MRARPLAPAEVDLGRFDAMLFDLDGVITRTASVHAAAWKRLFDVFLREWSSDNDAPFVPFDIATDYVRYVDGRRRQDGVSSFLGSRGISLPLGAADDGPDVRSVHGLGNRKDGYFNECLDSQGVEVFDDAVRLVKALEGQGKALAVVSASENCDPVLERANLLSSFPVRVTGLDATAQHLEGKPAPDTFLEAARRLGVAPADAVVFEDAVAGVEAGAAGAFGLVVGVDRRGAADELSRHGADLVVDDLTLLLPQPGGGSP